MLIPSSAPSPHPHYFSLQVLAWPSLPTLKLYLWCHCQPSGPSSSLSCCFFWASTARSVFLILFHNHMCRLVSCCNVFIFAKGNLAPATPNVWNTLSASDLPLTSSGYLMTDEQEKLSTPTKAFYYHSRLHCGRNIVLLMACITTN